MAFSIHSLKLITDLVAHEGWPRPVKIVCMGYPDMLIAPAILRKHFDLPQKLEIREDSESVLTWHGMMPPAGAAAEVVESAWLLRRLGFEPRWIDITPARGGEILQDMNLPIADAMRGYFDIVYDAGGLEHYFNVGQAVKNMLDLCRVGGVIYHGNPHLACNHGFYNFCPVFYHDFYRQNGHELMGGAVALKNQVPAGQLPLLGRYRLNDASETWIQVLIKKMNANPVKWPTQTKYRDNPNLQGRVN